MRARRGEPLPTSSARELWGPILAREPTTAPRRPASRQKEDDADEPIVIKALKFGKDALDGEIPASGGDLSKTFNTHLGKSANFGPYSLQVPLAPLVTAGFGAGGAMSAKADASLKLTGTNIASAAFGQAKKQHVTASGTGSASGTIAASLVAGIKFGVAGLANVGIYGQGTLAFRADGNASFDGSIQRLKPKKARRHVGSVAGQHQLQGEDQGLADRRGPGLLRVPGAVDLQRPVRQVQDRQVDAGRGRAGPHRDARAGQAARRSPSSRGSDTLLKPGVTEEIRKRTQAEREMAEKLASAGAAGSPVARKVLRAPGDDPPPDDPAAGGGAPPPAGGGAAAPPAAAARPRLRRRRAAPAGPQAEPAGPAGAPRAGGRAPAAAANNADLAAIAGVQPGGAAARRWRRPGSFTLESEPKIEE